MHWSPELFTWALLCGIFAISWMSLRLKKNNRPRNIRVAEEVQEMSRMKRAVGYCKDTECEEYSKGVFLLNHGDTFYCSRCRSLGQVEKEVGSHVGDGSVFKEVRVEYNFDAVHNAYRETAIVRDESLWGPCSTYMLMSPLIKTEKRALKVAETVLSNLNRSRDFSDDAIPATTETILSFDDSPEEFNRKLENLRRELEDSPLCRAREENRIATGRKEAP